jgi:uncharacterized protein YecE (DUF72 family)
MPPRPQFLVGTASWTDPTLVKSDVFYPPALKTAEDRLRFYAAQFNTVEVDATYYALVSERNADLWAERTPPGFVFNIKAFAMLTQHPVDATRLPAAVKSMLPAGERAATRLRHPPREVLEMAFGMFWSALEPLRAAGKLGHLLFQFPPYFTARPSNLDYIAGLKQRMPGAAVAIEFRHNSWLEGAQRAETSAFSSVAGLPSSRSTRRLQPSSRFSRSPARKLTCASMAATARTGTSATAAPPSVSSISMRKPNWPRGPSG